MQAWPRGGLGPSTPPSYLDVTAERQDCLTMGGSVSQKAGHFTNGCEPLFFFRHNALELALLYVRRQDIRTFEGKHSDKRPNVQRLRAASYSDIVWSA